MTEENKVFDIEDRLINFAVLIIREAEDLPRTKAGNHISSQLIRCGTSPASNDGEAQSAEYRLDFINKIKICLKELRETRIWLLMIKKGNMVRNKSNFEFLINENNELISIFVKSIRTAKEKTKIKKNLPS